MHFLQNLEPMPILDSAFSLFVAFICGLAIGAERQYKRHSAGLRTNALVAIGAAAFVDIAQRLAGDAESIRVIAYVVSGIGFLGAGVIMKEGRNIHGLNSAATLWCSAAVGCCAGSDLIAEAFLVTAVVLVANTLLNPLVNRINSLPLGAGRGETSFILRTVTESANLSAVRRLMVSELERMNYPVSTIEIDEQGEERVEVSATLARTAIVVSELDDVVAALLKNEGVQKAYWENGYLD